MHAKTRRFAPYIRPEGLGFTAQMIKRITRFTKKFVFTYKRYLHSWLVLIMKKILLILFMIPQLLMGQSEDQNVIRQITENWISGWQTCNSALAVEGFAEDVDWVNAFGVKKRGREEVQAFLDWVFSLPNATERKNSEKITSIRFIRSDVALVNSDFQVEKQRYVTGEEMPDRKGHAIRVMTKEEGLWQIVSMMIMDEKPSRPPKTEIGLSSESRNMGNDIARLKSSLSNKRETLSRLEKMEASAAWNAFLKKDKKLSIDSDAAYDEMRVYLDDESSWVRPGAHIMVLKKK